MNRRSTNRRDDDDPSWDDDDSPSWDEPDRASPDEDEPYVECRTCGAEILEMAERCPHCGDYCVAGDPDAGRHPTWVVVTAAICLLIALGWFFFA